MREAKSVAVALSLLFVACGLEKKDAETLPGIDGGSEPAVPVATEVGKPFGPQAKATIGAIGGTLESADGRLKIDVPAGAVAADTEFTIEPISNNSPSGVGAAYRLGPASASLSSPVTLTFRAPEAGVSRTGIGGLGIAVQDADGFWAWQTGIVRDEAAKTVSAQAAHFSDWSLVEGVQLQPMIASAKEGTSVGLRVVSCFPEPTSDGIVPLAYRCASNVAPLVVTEDWSVNGQPGGNATVGTIRGTGLEGTFTAPSTRPNPNTVAASVKVGANAATMATTLISQISIGDPATFHGELALTARNAIPFSEYAAQGEVTITPARFDDGSYDDGIDLTGYDVNGTITLTSRPLSIGEDIVCDTDQPTVAISGERLNLWKQPWAMDWSFTVNWQLQCHGSQPGSETTLPLYVQWFQGCLPTEIVRYPVADPSHLEGSMTRSCQTDTTTVTWSFAQ